MRARQPDVVGAVERDGVRVGYEALGAEGRPALVLLTLWAIVHMRQWKLPVPALARRFRLVSVEGRGNGAADRPRTEAAYADHELVADAVAVIDAVGVNRAVVIGLSMGGRHALQLAAARHAATQTGTDPRVGPGPPGRGCADTRGTRAPPTCETPTSRARQRLDPPRPPRDRR
jgi:pimeloyl-ACP methyl ester carboxylesterase